MRDYNISLHRVLIELEKIRKSRYEDVVEAYSCVEISVIETEGGQS